MSLYDATQQQRANERRKAGLASAGQDMDDVNAKLRQAQAEQRDFCAQTGLKRDYFRERGGKQNQQPSPNPERTTKAVLPAGLPNGTMGSSRKQALTGDPITDNLGATKRRTARPRACRQGYKPELRHGVGILTQLPTMRTCLRASPTWVQRAGKGYAKQFCQQPDPIWVGMFY